jgi:hypothetical protein
MFEEDCDLFGKDYDAFLRDQIKSAAIEGHVGILVDKPNIQGTTYESEEGVDVLDQEDVTDDVTVETRADEVENRVYPYVASYRPQSILDWKWERDRFNRPQLVFLKLYEDDGTYRLWWRDRWEVWKEPESESGAESVKVSTGSSPASEVKDVDPEMDAVLVSYGPNPLGEIPFIWLLNEETDEKFIGMSDITDIARIDASIMRNLSQGEEIINYAAFPMMRKPKPEAGEQQDDTVGTTAVLEFDPEKPDSKPDWLASEAEQPISVILEWIGKKIEEVYRSSNTGGMAAMEVQSDARSGAALKAEFQLLNAKLVGKGNKLEDVEYQILEYWLKWQEMQLKEEAVIERSDSYDVQDLMTDLDNILTASVIVKSEMFKKKLQKNVVRMLLPGEPDEELIDIDKEIDEYDPMEAMTEWQDNLPGGGGGDDGEEEEGGRDGSRVVPIRRTQDE